MISTDLVFQTDMGRFSLSSAEYDECMKQADKRVSQQISDAKRGDMRAAISYGKIQTIKSRNIQTRIEDAFMGTIGEAIAAKVVQSKWSKEIGQYKEYESTDLIIRFNGNNIKCEVRSTRYKNEIVCRPHSDKYKLDRILIGITNLPLGPICSVGWIKFKDMMELIDGNSQWKVDNGIGNPYYRIPFEYFSKDFSQFKQNV